MADLDFNLLPNDFVMPACPNCGGSLVYSSTSYTPYGERHACGCLSCRGLYDVDQNSEIMRIISAGKSLASHGGAV